MNVGYIEWESLPDDVNTKAAALLQLLASELGPVNSWQRVGPPSRAPGSLVADAEAAQAAAAAEQRQQLLHQQRDMMLHGWNAGSAAGAAAAASGAGMGAALYGGAFMPGMVSGLSAAAPGSYGMDRAGAWGAASNATSLGYSAWLPCGDGLGMLSLPGGLGAWGSGALAGNGGLGTPGPSLLQQLTHLQQQMQQQQACDALVAAEGTASAAGAPASEDAGVLSAKDRMMSMDAAASSMADGMASVPPSPASGMQDGGSMAGGEGGVTPAGPDALPGAEELQAALAKAQQRWNNSPSSTHGSGGSGGSNKKAAAFMWGDPTSANIWAP